MAHGVLGQALGVVDGLCREGMAHKLRVQITRMIRRLEREAKIIHREHVFEELRFLEVANASGLPSGIKLVRNRVRAGVEIMVIARLVDAYAPENDGGMVPITTNHAADIIDRKLLPGLVSYM